MLESVDDITYLTDPAEKRLNPRQQVAYKQHRRGHAEWLYNLGKTPEKAEGYSLTTVDARLSQIDLFYRWVWDEEDRFTTNVTHAHADAWMKALANSDNSRSYNAALQKAVKSLFKWRHHEQGGELWEPDITFSDPSTNRVPKNVLEWDEWRAVREAALEYGSVPHYHSVSPAERRDINAMLAERFEKPVEQVGESDWDRANGYKFVSMFWLGMDAGLRPKEIGRLRVEWLDLDNQLLRVPRDGSVKNEEDWKVPMLEETAQYLELWLQERACREKYEGSDRVWLTKYGNPYSSWSVNYHWRRIRDVAEIETEGRNLPYYSLRHTQGTNMVEKAGMPSAGAQLRQKSMRSTEKYAHARTETQRDGLEETR